MADGALDAGAIVGLLADDDRRLVLAAIELGHGTFDAVVAVTSLPASRVYVPSGEIAIPKGLFPTGIVPPISWLVAVSIATSILPRPVVT